MTDINLKTIASGYNLNKINDNFETVEDIINDEMLHTTGGNNTMSQELDMNSNRILNLPAPLGDTEPLRKCDITTSTAGATVQYVDDSIKAGAVKPHNTIADAIVDAELISGMAVDVKEHTAGNGGSGKWDVVLASTVSPNSDDVRQCTGVVTLALVLRKDNQTNPYQRGVIGDGVANDTSAIKNTIEDNKQTVFDKSKSHKVTAISLSDSIHLEGATLVFEGSDAGFDIDSPIDGLTMTDTRLIGDGVLASSQKGITSNSALTNGNFLRVTLEGFQQGFDLNSAVNTKFIGGHVKGSVGEAAGQGYGIIAGSSSYGVFGDNLFESCQRHALYLNNALYTTVTGNVFKNHRDGLAASGGLGALQIAGQARGITATGNTFADCTGPEIVISPQPTNTETLKSITVTGNSHFGGQSANIRIGGATPTATENVDGVNVADEVFMPASTYDGSIVQIYNGFNVSVSDCTWGLRGGTGATLIGVQIGLVGADDTLLEGITISDHKGVLTKSSGNSIFVKIDSAYCLGTASINIFNNPIEADIYIDYQTTPTNPNIRSDNPKVQALTLPVGGSDVNVAGYNIFSITGNAGASVIDNFDNGYLDKEIEVRFVDTLVSMSSTGNKSIGGAFTSTNKDVLFFKYDGTTWREQHRSLNT